MFFTNAYGSLFFCNSTKLEIVQMAIYGCMDKYIVANLTNEYYLAIERNRLLIQKHGGT